jgi:hypothetical protein
MIIMAGELRLVVLNEGTVLSCVVGDLLGSKRELLMT